MNWRQIYVSDMGAVERAIENEEWLAARDLMRRHVPTTGQEDQRGFEWRYYWGQARGDQMMTLQAHDGEVADLEVSPDGQCLATYGLEGRVKIWDLRDMSLVHEWNSLGKGSGMVSFSSDQQFLSIGTQFVSGQMKIHIKDFESKQDAWTPGGDWGFASMSPVGSRLLTLRSEGLEIPMVDSSNIQIWDYAEKPNELRSLKEALAEFRDNPVFTDEQRIEFATRFFELNQGVTQVIWQDTIFEMETRSRLWTVTGQERALAFSPDESSLLTLTTNRVFFRESTTGKLQKSVEFKEPIWNHNFRARTHARWFDLAPDGNRIAVTELKPAIRIIDTNTGETTSVLDERMLLLDVRFLPSADQILFRAHDGVGGLWDLGENEPIFLKAERAIEIMWMDISPDSKTVVAVCGGNAIRVWRATDGTLERTIRGLREQLSKIAFAPDGRSVASIRSREPKIGFWNTQTWRQVAALDRVASAHDVFGFSPDGKNLLISGRGGTRIWRAPTLDEVDRQRNSHSAPNHEPK